MQDVHYNPNVSHRDFCFTQGVDFDTLLPGEMVVV